MNVLEIINALASIAVLFAAIRALSLFHCRVGLIARAALAAIGFFAWAGIATGEILELRGADQGFVLSLGALAAVLLWQTRGLVAVCSPVKKTLVGSNRKMALSQEGRPYRC